jgi:Zn-dependent M28 family amino/carboxypeptidase
MAGSLRNHVEMLAGQIGGRDARNFDNLRRDASYIETELQHFGYKTARQSFEDSGLTFDNIEAQLTGTAEPRIILVIGAHYDTAGAFPGANYNASGVAATLELARRFAGQPQTRSIRWVFFANEEPPYFQGPAMGSAVYARRCRQRSEDIAGMLSLETIGCYSDEKGSQQYPAGLGAGLPDRGDFLGFVANVRSVQLLRRAVGTFRNTTSLPAEGAAAPAAIPGVGWSDHWAFWQEGYRALMVTDTAPYRYPWYHTAADTPEKLDYQRMARALTGLAGVVRELASN